MYIYIYIIMQKVKEYCEGKSAISNMKTKGIIENMVEEPCLIISYESVTRNLMEQLNPKAIIVSGISQDLQELKKEELIELNEILLHIEIPVLCICGSHQLLAEVYNKDINQVDRFYNYPIRKLAEEEKINSQQEEYFRAEGFFEIRIEKEDKIFQGLKRKTYMKCTHGCEVKELPKEFERLASSEHSKIEAMKHKNKPIYGLQFHPEKYEENYKDGATILKNFANIVSDFWKDK